MLVEYTYTKSDLEYGLIARILRTQDTEEPP